MADSKSLRFSSYDEIPAPLLRFLSGHACDWLKYFYASPRGIFNDPEGALLVALELAHQASLSNVRAQWAAGVLEDMRVLAMSLSS